MVDASRTATPDLVKRAVQKAQNVVLVHGAYADGSSWADVIPLLQRAGLNVMAVQNPLTSLADDVAATRRALDLQDGPTVLAGHSWAGTVISEAGVHPNVTPSSMSRRVPLTPVKTTRHWQAPIRRLRPRLGWFTQGALRS